MKTMKFLTYATFVLFLGFAVSSCSGDDGIDGVTGPAGADGTNGTDGADGADGNANVIYSGWFDPTWIVPASSASFYHDAPEITQSVLDTGVIMAYMRIGTTVYPLPISFIGDTYPKEFNFWAELNSIRIWFTAENSYTPSTRQFRYVIIPGNVSASGRVSNPQQAIYNELAEANVDLFDYYAVCAYYGINPE